VYKIKYIFIKIFYRFHKKLIFAQNLKIVFLTFKGPFWCIFSDKGIFSWQSAKLNLKKIVYFNRRPHILKIFDISQKSHYYSKFSKLKLKINTTFVWVYDLKIKVLGSFYPNPELGLKKNA
jgi:hypothetical protein